jgi:hypothetical protein
MAMINYKKVKSALESSRENIPFNNSVADNFFELELAKAL